MATSPNPTLDFKLNRALMRTAVNAFARRHGPDAVDKAVRKLAFDVVGYTSRALNGAGAGYAHPKRIDTGRYRAAWNVAIEVATGRAAGSKAIAAKSKHTGEPNPGRTGDGRASWAGRGMAKTVTVINAVEYGPYLEFGARRMAPGRHVTRGLMVAARGALQAVGIPLSKAWDR